MILADKIIKERKKLGMSQEELAEKMNVSRQAVSKWEGGQSVPEIEKILQMSSLFGVTTDYLLKDEVEASESGFTAEHAEYSEYPQNETIPTENYTEPQKEIRTVTLKEAENYLEQSKKTSLIIAIGTFLCIIAAIPLLLLSGLSEANLLGLSEDNSGILGVILLILIIAPAIGLFVYTGLKGEPYEYLEKEPFETESGVTQMVIAQKDAFAPTYTKFNIIGTIFCVLSPISLFIGSFTDNDLTVIASLCVTLFIAGIGVVFFILAGIRHESMQKLLKEGDYSEKSVEEKKNKSIKGIVFTIYWLIATAIYLLLLFTSGNYEGGWNGWKGDNSWIVWPIAAVLFPVVMLICDAVQTKRTDN